MLHVQVVGQFVEVFLRNLRFVYHDGVVEVAAFDETGLEQRLNFAHKHKGAGAGYLVGEVLHVVERGKLAVDELRLERNHGRDGELLVGQDDDARARGLVAELNFLLDDVEVLGRVLLHNAYALYVFHIENGRTVEYGEFGAVHLYEAVVDAHGVECGHGVLNGAASGFALRHHSAARGVNYILGNGLDDGFAFQVDALYLVAVILGGRIEGDRQVEARVQALAEERETSAQCLLS